MPEVSPADWPLMTKPPVPAAIVARFTLAPKPAAWPNTT